MVACAVFSFHDGADIILNSAEHNERKMDYESRPTTPYVLLNETNLLTFKDDAEDPDELLEEIKSLESLSLCEKRNCLKKLIRPNRYLGKTALMIASEKKDVKMVKILLHKLPPKLLDQTDSNGKTALFFACDDTLDDQDFTKEVVQLFLDLQKGVTLDSEEQEIDSTCCCCCKKPQNATEIRQIDLLAKDNAGQTAFDYLPPNLKTEFASQYPELFSEV